MSPIFGLAFALIAWLVTARKNCGNLGVSCTESNDPMLAGNVVALLSPLIFVPIFTLIFGLDHYDWESMKAIRQGDDHDLAADANLDVEDIPGGHIDTTAELEAEQRKLLRAGKISKTITVVMTLAFLVLWPMRKSSPYPRSSSTQLISTMQQCTVVDTSLAKSSSQVGHSPNLPSEIFP